MLLKKQTKKHKLWYYNNKNNNPCIYFNLTMSLIQLQIQCEQNKLTTFNSVWKPKGLEFMILLQAEKVWQWCKSPGGTLGLIRSTKKKLCGINIHSPLWSPPYGNYCAAYNEFFGECTMLCVLCYYKQSSDI